jgi:hypothetical protein
VAGRGRQVSSGAGGSDGCSLPGRSFVVPGEGRQPMMSAIASNGPDGPYQSVFSLSSQLPTHDVLV